MKKEKFKYYIVVLVFLFVFLLGNGCGTSNSPVKTVQVPDITNLKIGDAEQVLSNAGLMFEITDSQFSDTVPIDHVISQDPAANTSVKSGSLVKAVVSNGSESIIAPDLTGKKIDEANAILKNVGLHISSISEVENGADVGTIISQDPQPNTSLPLGAGIKVTVSIGTFVTVPNLIGMTTSDAQAAIKSAGIILYKVVTTDGGAGIPSGIVLYQYPMPGAKVSQGSQILIKVSK
ncbi:MAG: PASTA domain-containing protein [Caldisericaceae bacterium]